jgi:intein-encoded DNA endonuclease-like protein
MEVMSMRRRYSYEEYLKAMQMYKDGVGPTEISRALGIPLGTVEDWIYRGKRPPAARWHPEPSKELAYVLGVLHGDAYLVKPRKNIYEVEARVKDIEFAVEFSKVTSKLLGRKYREPEWDDSHNRWRVYYRSKAFHTWYREQNLKSLRQYIEHNEGTVAYFLRGLYDSEGCKYRCKQVSLSNNSEKLLYYVQYLLEKYFDIIATGPYLVVEAGSIHTIKNGEKIKANHNIYSIAISRKQDVQRFLSEVGFSIKEKQYGLPRRKN